MRYPELMELGRERIRSAGMEPYLDLGAETGSQNRLNRAHMDSLTFEMRILGSQPASIETELFGHKLASPIIASPLCESRILNRIGPWNPSYLDLIAAGLADAGSMMATGNLTFDQLDSIVNQGAPVVHIVHPFKDPERIIRHLDKAHEIGCVGVGINVDGMFGCKAHDEPPGPDYLGPQSIELLAEYVSSTPLPFVIKGILSEQDALRARALGVNGLIVSIYGGEAIDYAEPVLEALPRIRSSAPDLTVLVDSGFRRGTDVLKALALGANGVGLVTALMIAVAGAGREGVRRLLELLNEELQRSMSLVGAPTVAELDHSVIHATPA